MANQKSKLVNIGKCLKTKPIIVLVYIKCYGFKLWKHSAFIKLNKWWISSPGVYCVCLFKNMQFP